MPSPGSTDYSKIFSSLELDPSLEAAFLLKPTGMPVAGWTRNPVPHEVVSVMAAAFWGALDTMVRTLGRRGPPSAMVEVDELRILAIQVPPNWTLLLVAPCALDDGRLRREAQRISKLITAPRRSGTTRSLPLNARD